MRVDIYQHVAKDVESIEDQVYGAEEKKLNSLLFIQEVYAQESSETSEAVDRRKERTSAIGDYFKKGYIGENRQALLEIVAKDIPSDKKAEIESTISRENQDRI